MTSTVLVTGACGFIGRYVARCYSGMGWRVVGIGRGDWSRDEWEAWGLSEWHSAEISPEALKDHVAPDVIVHCAGSGSVGFSLANPYEDFIRNVDSAAAVLEHVRLRAPESRVVMLSSAGVYGKISSGPIPEWTSTDPVSPYGAHKLMMEQLCRGYAAAFDLRLAVVRLFSIYGAGLRKQLLWDACNKLAAGDGGFFGSGEEVRDWLHVADAAKLIVLAAEHAANPCVIVNGGTGTGTSVREIVHHVAHCLDAKVSPTFSGVAKPGDPDALVADASAVHGWGWHAEMSWQEGISEYVRWFEGAR